MAAADGQRSGTPFGADDDDWTSNDWLEESESGKFSRAELLNRTTMLGVTNIAHDQNDSDRQRRRNFLLRSQAPSPYIRSRSTVVTPSTPLDDINEECESSSSSSTSNGFITQTPRTDKQQKTNERIEEFEQEDNSMADRTRTSISKPQKPVNRVNSNPQSLYMRDSMDDQRTLSGRRRSSPQKKSLENKQPKQVAASLVAVNVTQPKVGFTQMTDEQNSVRSAEAKRRTGQQIRVANPKNISTSAQQSFVVQPSQSDNNVRDDFSPASFPSDLKRRPKSILKQKILYDTNQQQSIQATDRGKYVKRVDLNQNSTAIRQDHGGRKVGLVVSSKKDRSQSVADLSSINVRRCAGIERDENISKKASPSQTTDHSPSLAIPFNGPFFTLQEVSGRQHRSKPLQIIDEASNQSVRETSQSSKSSSNQQSGRAYRQSVANESHEGVDDGDIDDNNDHGDDQRYSSREQTDLVLELSAGDGRSTVIGSKMIDWPPASKKTERFRAQSVPPSIKPRSLTDPDQIDEYRRQKQLEIDVMEQREAEMVKYLEKQKRASEFQKELYRKRFADGRDLESPLISPESNSLSHEELREINMNAWSNQQEKDPEPQFMRVYETRPISAMSETSDTHGLSKSPGATTWKRIYLVNQPKPTARNEIITSQQLLQRERFNIDLLRRREAFIEKPRPPLTIHRIGKCWQPPPEQPYVWPSVRRPISIEPGGYHDEFAPHAAEELERNDGYKWEPLVYEPGYKFEQKKFTPPDTPPGTPRGFGTGPLDEPAKRQTRYLVQPSSDGSHRPKPAFGGPRATPFGGFYPHAPNAVKVVKKRQSQSMSSLAPSALDADEEVQVIHESRFHRFGEPSPSSASQSDDLADWEKIYDLPPHSSTITPRDTPRNVDVKRKLVAFENFARRMTSVQQNSPQESVTSPRPFSSMRTLSVDDSLQSPSSKYYEQTQSIPLEAGNVSVEKTAHQVHRYDKQHPVAAGDNLCQVGQVERGSHSNVSSSRSEQSGGGEHERIPLMRSSRHRPLGTNVQQQQQQLQNQQHQQQQKCPQQKQQHQQQQHYQQRRYVHQQQQQQQHQQQHLRQQPLQIQRGMLAKRISGSSGQSSTQSSASRGAGSQTPVQRSSLHTPVYQSVQPRQKSIHQRTRTPTKRATDPISNQTDVCASLMTDHGNPPRRLTRIPVQTLYYNSSNMPPDSGSIRHQSQQHAEQPSRTRTIAIQQQKKAK